MDINITNELPVSHSGYDVRIEEYVEKCEDENDWFQ